MPSKAAAKPQVIGQLALKLTTSLLIIDRGKIAYYGPNRPDRQNEMRELYLKFAG